MSDIFISYSRKDSSHALELAERLRLSGMEVWIDQRGIEAATSWSSEIVGAIEECQAFLLLISESSLVSDNVVKELSIASESKRPILPVEILPTELPRSFKYQLTGIQRAQLSDFEGIMRSLIKLGVANALPRPLPQTRGEKDNLFPSRLREGLGEGVRDTRKSLMILPFEDLSPTQDNGWFADGIVSEMLGALGNVKALRLIDWNTAKEFKTRKVATAVLAKELEVRYFLEGQVRKAGENIKVSVSLLDFETGDHLWQDSMKGTMSDIFEMQENVAIKVVEGLKIHLASGEKKKLAERGTENAEAYELYMKANEYFLRQTKEGFQLAVQLITEAIKLDRGYARAYLFKANVLIDLYRLYDRTPALLDEAEMLCKEALRRKPDLFGIYLPLSQIYMYRGQLAEAEEAAKESIRKDPQNFGSHFTLGFFYNETGQYAKAIAPYEESVRLKPDNLTNLWNLVVNCDAAGEQEKCGHWATVALPYHERHLKLHPDDEGMRVNHALLLLLSGRTEDAYAAAMELKDLKDGNSLYNTACLFGKLGDPTEALRSFRKAIEAGYRYIRLLKGFLTDEKEGVLALQGTPEYEEVREMVEKIETAGNNA